MGGRCDERRVSTSLSIPPRKVRCAEQQMREPGAPVSASSAFVPFLLRVPVPKKIGRCQRGVKILSTCHFFDLSFLLTGVEAAMLVNRGGGPAPSRLISSVVPPPLSGGISRRLRRARFFPPPPPPTPGRGSGLIPFAVRVRLCRCRATGPTTAPVVAASGPPRLSPYARRGGVVVPTVPAAALQRRQRGGQRR